MALTVGRFDPCSLTASSHRKGLTLSYTYLRKTGGVMQASDEALDHAITALSKASGFLLVTYQITNERSIAYSMCSSNLIDQALLTKIAQTYLDTEIHDLLIKPEGGTGDEDGQDDQEYGL
jgi:hypothetical protein